MGMNGQKGLWRSLAHASAVLMVIGQGTAVPQPGPTRFSYASDGQWVPLSPSTRYISLRLDGGSPDLPAALRGASSSALPAQGLKLFQLPRDRTNGEMERLLQALRSEPGIELVAPVFEASSTKLIVGDRFIAQLAKGTPLTQLERLNTEFGVETVRRASWDARTYLLRVRHGDALGVANAYHRLPEIAYAHPDFVRVMDRRRTAPIESWDRLDIGPGGTLEGRSSTVRKRPNGYRSIERHPAVESPSPRQHAPSGGAPITDATSHTRSSVIKETVWMDDFEGPLTNTWFVNSPSTTWSDVSFRRFSGAWSAYCVASTTPPPGPYPPAVNAWMHSLTGFSLKGALDARLLFKAWIRTEAGVDDIFYTASEFPGSFTGWSVSGDWTPYGGPNGFVQLALDLKDQMPLLGKDDITLAFRFDSDGTIQYEGVYLDDVVVQMITGGYQSITSDEWDHLQWSLQNNGQSWGTLGVDIQALEAWEVSRGSSSITIGVIDDGIHLVHPDLSPKLVSGYDATGGGSGGGAGSIAWRGTNCAGVAAAETDNGLGVAGIAPLAKLMPVRVIRGTTTQDSWFADGITWAADNGADILLHGWTIGAPSTAIRQAIDHALEDGRSGKGAITIFPAGDDSGPVDYPASLPQTLAVGATSPCDERASEHSCDGEVWWGSNYGPELDLSAPGIDLYSTHRQGSYNSGFRGTAAAASVVAGVAALALGQDASLTVAQLSDLLRDTSVDIGPPGFDEETGHGRVDAYQALLAPSPNGKLTVALAGSGAGTATSYPSGINCGTSCEETFPLNTPVDLYGYPVVGSQFEGWSGPADCSDGQVTIAPSVTCTATFNPCSGSSVVSLPAQVVNTQQTFEACNTIEAGSGGFRIEPTGIVTFSVGNMVVLENGFEVAAGATFSAVMGLPISP